MPGIYTTDSVETKRFSLSVWTHFFRLSGCNLSDGGILAAVLHSPASGLRELNLSENKLQDSGVRLVSAPLESLR